MIKKISVKRITLVLLLIIAVPACPLIYSSFLSPKFQNWQRTRYINSLVILDEQKTAAASRTNVQPFTGTSKFTMASFVVDDSLGAIYNEATGNLLKQGYAINEEFDTVLYSSTGTNTIVDTVSVNATKDKRKIIALRFKLKDQIVCDYDGETIGKPCYYTAPVTIQNSGLFDKKVVLLSVWYSDDGLSPAY